MKYDRSQPIEAHEELRLKDTSFWAPLRALSSSVQVVLISLLAINGDCLPNLKLVIC